MRGTLAITGRLLGVAALSLIAADPALAGGAPAPGPLLGAGAPVLALFASGYYLLKRYRTR